MTKKAFVESRGGRYIVKTGIATPGGFIKVKKLDSFYSAQEANAKADLVNYISRKIAEYCQKRQEAISG